MPYKKLYKRKRNYRKYNRKIKPKLGKPSKGLKQSVYLFKRKTCEVIQLNSQTPPTGWEAGGFNSLYRQTEYKLSDMRDTPDFTTLFSMYKISAVSVKFFFNNTGSTNISTVSTPPQTYSNSQILVMYCPWKAGASEIMDAEYMLTCQASKRRIGLNGGKPIKLYMPLRQLSVMYRSGIPPAATYDYTSVKPQWISTQEIDTPHYGVGICFQKADQGLFAAQSTNYQSCRIETTYYIACKGVV